MVELRACPECGAEVPIGRLSCGACGALLASVDRHVAAEAPAGAPAPIALDMAEADGATPTVTEAAEEMPASTEVADPSAMTAALEAPASGAQPVVEAAPGPAIAESPLAASAAVPAPEGPPPEAVAASEEIELPRPPMPPIPGAYLSPSVVTRSAPITATQPSASAPRRRLEPSAPWDEPPTTPEPASRAEPVPPAAPASASPGSASPGRAPLLDLPFAVAPGIGPRLVAGGAALAIFAFVLPWVPEGGFVIGGSDGTGYFSSWGLAAVGNVLPFLVAWVSLVLAVLPNRVPRFVALGVLPLVLGGVFAGFGWTYLIGPFGAGIGIWALAVGAVLLAAGGILVLRGDGSAG